MIVISSGGRSLSLSSVRKGEILYLLSVRKGEFCTCRQFERAKFVYVVGSKGRNLCMSSVRKGEICACHQKLQSRGAGEGQGAQKS